MSKNSILAVLCGVVAMTVIDLSVVNVAFHRSLIGAAVFAGLGALVAATMLRSTETVPPAPGGIGAKAQRG